jgi:hypothetical protein
MTHPARYDNYRFSLKENIKYYFVIAKIRENSALVIFVVQDKKKKTINK